jgi:G3E family GTPase
MRTRIPITVITGFLGAGKTTLLRRLIDGRGSRRFAIIENEYGEVGIDHELVVREGEELFELNDGCLCCTVRGDLMRILRELLVRRHEFDHVIIETTGLADPAPVAQTLLLDAEIADSFVLDGVVTVVDAKHVGEHLDRRDESVAQIVFADLIVLNKADLVTDAALDELDLRVRQMNATAAVIRSLGSAVPVERVLGVGGAHGDMPDDVGDQTFHDHHHEHGPDCHHPRHPDEVGSESFLLDRPLIGTMFGLWLDALLASHGGDIYRTKGILHVRGDDRRQILQGVHRLFTVEPDRAWPPGPRQSRVVFIGRNLDRAALERGLNDCCGPS